MINYIDIYYIFAVIKPVSFAITLHTTYYMKNSMYFFLMYFMFQVILRAREAEMQFLRQEARSLREELKIARMVLTSLSTLIFLDYKIRLQK